jgi:hypothetical protein
MVPHRTKLRELIIQAWKRYFHALKLELAVLFKFSVRALSHIKSFMSRTPLVRSRSQQTYGLMIIANLT